MPGKPSFVPSPPELVERFGAVLDRLGGPETTQRKMFGYPCAWVRGNMATGLFADAWWVRLPPERLAAALASGEARPFEVMPGRAMQAYAVMAAPILADEATLDAWIRDALDYTATLPPKR